jgi:hypothetical protein
MTAIHETASPRIRSNLSDHELETLSTPTPDDLVFLHRTTNSTVAVFGGLVLLKTFQRLGYFPPMDTLPPRLIQHLATTMGVLMPDVLLQQYDQRRLREWQGPLIRHHLGITAFQDGGRHALVGAMLKPRQSFLSAGGELTRPCLANTSSVGHQGCIARRRRPLMRESRGFKIR